MLERGGRMFAGVGHCRIFDRKASEIWFGATGAIRMVKRGSERTTALRTLTLAASLWQPRARQRPTCNRGAD